MAFIKLNFFSEALGMQTEVNVVIPQRSALGEIGIENKATAEKYKCLYLLHGLSDDHTIWMRRTSIERYASNYGICVVMPCGAKSFYSDMKYGMNYYTYIAKELPRVIRDFFNVSDKREDNFIAGLSMGGYGALKIALRECDSFCAGAGLSPCGDVKSIGFEAEMRPIFGDELIVPDEDDLLWLADAKKDHPNKPRLFIGIGTNDFLYENVQCLRHKLTENGYDFTYREGPGAHEWGFWDEYIRHALWWMFNN
ncbi:MAG: esterase family protein [Clostridia bacterium]|nr:esterase family protein [Clostridia bacterium]